MPLRKLINKSIYYDEEKDGLYVGARNTLFFKVKPIECENEEKER